MVKFTVKTDGFKKLYGFTDKQQREVEKTIPRMLRRIVYTINREVTRLASNILFRIRTGAFISGIDGGEVQRIRHNRYKWKFGNTAPHAIFLEDGTKKHPIDPVNGRFLRFLGFNPQRPGGQTWTFAKHVEHPGTKAYRPYLLATQNKAADFEKIIEEEVDIALRKALRS